ncbi:MAG: serpin family protein [Phycisphaerae bacterium]|nr:serpin family protein [Phycisphaerae bacterium]
MSHKTTLNVLLAMVLFAAVNSVAAEPKSPAKPLAKPPIKPAVKDEATVVEGSNEFALDLYKKLAGQKGNVAFSPSSIHTALAMTFAGARGKTATQMADTMHYDKLKGDAFYKAYSRLISKTKPDGKPKFELSIANALWLQKGYDFLPAFLKINTKYFQAKLADVDFAHNTEAARQTINKWVEAETKDKIKNLLPKGTVTTDTALVLTNAIYFKSDWAKPFNKQSTRDEIFHVSPKKTVKVPTMDQLSDFGYMETPDLQALKKPYKGNELSMVVLLPKKRHGLAALEKSLTMKKLSGWLKKLRKEQTVWVYLPKFKTDYNVSLKEVLAKMGMIDAFIPAKADFPGMSSGNLFISLVLHKAFVNVNEKGTEAAAATVVSKRFSAWPPKAPVFRADHPFIFLIRHEKTGAILFMGRVAEPK